MKQTSFTTDESYLLGCVMPWDPLPHSLGLKELDLGLLPQHPLPATAQEVQYSSKLSTNKPVSYGPQKPL